MAGLTGKVMPGNKALRTTWEWPFCGHTASHADHTALQVYNERLPDQITVTLAVTNRRPGTQHQ